jgi:hypothetical protein
MEFKRKLDYQVPESDERDYVFTLSSDDAGKLGASSVPSYFKLPVNRVEDQGQRDL